MTAPGSQDLESALKQALERHLRGAETPPNLTESIRYSLLAPGKRIRPRLALACGHMLGLAPQASLASGLAIEMIHCFTLIHDDLPCMDDDDLRRGRPSNHKVYGEALALLAGDALMMLALDTLTDASPLVSAAHFSQALRRFAWACGPRGVIGGQAAESLLTPSSTRAELDRMHAMKTGALFSASLLIPMDLAGLSSSDPRGRALEQFASTLGLAFQIADDLEDAASESQAPTNILSYVSANEARDTTARQLQDALQGLQAHWRQGCAELEAIANEVVRSLGIHEKDR